MEAVSINSSGTLMKVTCTVGQTQVMESESIVDKIVCVTHLIRWTICTAQGIGMGIIG